MQMHGQMQHVAATTYELTKAPGITDCLAGLKPGYRLKGFKYGHSRGCFRMTLEWFGECRPCDPEVGVGLKQMVCRGTCAAWYAACRDDFFEFHPLTEELMPCGGASLLCSRLDELAVDGTDMCRKAALAVSEYSSSGGRQCFDGAIPPPLASCAITPVVQAGIQGWSMAADIKMLLWGALCSGVLYFWWRSMQRPSGGRLRVA
jgi:hypothetical protein